MYCACISNAIGSGRDGVRRASRAKVRLRDSVILLSHPKGNLYLRSRFILMFLYQGLEDGCMSLISTENQRMKAKIVLGTILRRPDQPARRMLT